MKVVVRVKPTPGARQVPAPELALPAITHATSRPRLLIHAALRPCLFGRGSARNHARQMLEAARRG